MTKFFFVLVTSFFLIACGGGSSSGEVSPTTDTPEAETPSEGDESGGDEQASEGDGEEGEQDNEQPSPENIDYSQVLCDDDLSAVIHLINQLRAQSQMCGEEAFPAVDALSMNALLDRAAEGHSANMANYDFFDHTGLDGSSPGDRISEQGYDWRSYGENIAAGQFNAQQAVNGWMNSPGHCRNIMNPNVTEMGLACVENSSASYGRYWTQVFARPQ
ncbi:CAP domain-containing protein [Corallincola spongiicola]|uniref:CAP domain-containing protein n=1 Tax=Corallincola spongiicola TaxID=2520508 RepID=A0ABY1WRV9_9GAMM|nr:CAP domain-containing protein [Corallincola spongiicola]TAA47461.1 CAP domain-containing protein [Corallincola spongiicola]